MSFRRSLAMSLARSQSPRRALVLVVLALVSGLLVGCTSRVEEPKAERTSTTDPSAGASAAAAQDRREAVGIMRARERALRAGDRKAFLATVSPRSSGFLRTQARYFDNLAQLPLTHIDLRVGDPDKMMQISSEGDYQLPVDFTMQLRGFDARPVTIPLIYTYRRQGGHLLLSDDRNPQNDVRWNKAPWDVTTIEVRRTDDLLGVFDQKTVGEADEVMGELQDALDVIDPLVPAWPGRVVVYDISDLSSMDQMSLMKVENTAGLQFDVPTKPGSDRIASSRFAVNPNAASGSYRALVFRHELVHVALGELDEKSPTWLVEGTAEALARSIYTQESLKEQGRLSLSGMHARRLATGRDFYQVRSHRNYELAALVCEYLIDSRGRGVLFDLMRSFGRAVSHHEVVTGGDFDVVARKELGMSTRELARAALDWAGVPHT